MERITIPFSVARNLINESDVLLVRGQSWISKIIQKAGNGHHSHAMVATWQNEQYKSLLECVEFREWKGSRVTSLANQVKLQPNIIDVFRPSPKVDLLKAIISDESVQIVSDEKIFKPRDITDAFRSLTGLSYGWKRIRYITYRKLILGKLWFTPNTSDEETDDLCMVCSTSIAYLFRKYYVDLVKNKPDSLIEPSDLARSPVLNYLFTIGELT